MTHDELNRLAAEKVMGIELAQDDSWWDGYYNYSNKGHYCSSIADAWLLVEKMMKDGFEMMLCTSGEDKTKAQCNIFLNRVIKGDKSADTAPLAITMACLKAVGVL